MPPETEPPSEGRCSAVATTKSLALTAGLFGPEADGTAWSFVDKYLDILFITLLCARLTSRGLHA